jgi:hypothetical protein
VVILNDIAPLAKKDGSSDQGRNNGITPHARDYIICACAQEAPAYSPANLPMRPSTALLRASLYDHCFSAVGHR